MNDRNKALKALEAATVRQASIIGRGNLTGFFASNKLTDREAALEARREYAEAFASSAEVRASQAAFDDSLNSF